MAVERSTTPQEQAPQGQTTVERDPNSQTKREFIGKGWNNVTQQGEHKGTEYINVTLDQDIDKLSIAKGSRIMLWPNEKRDGINPKTDKPYVDADYRVSVNYPEVAPAA